MALIYIDDSDPWLTEYESCEKLFCEIMEQLTQCNREPKTSQSFANLSAGIRLRMKQYLRQVDELKRKVDVALRSKQITIEEAERRMRQVELLQSKEIRLQKLYDSHLNDLASSRAHLLKSGGSVFVDGGTTSWAADNDDDILLDANTSVNDLMTRQEHVLQDQERGLEELCKVISRQKEIGQAISNEVDHQNEIIEDLADHMDRTDESLINKTRQVQTISSKDRTCGYWVVILLLFVSIVVVSLV